MLIVGEDRVPGGHVLFHGKHSGGQFSAPSERSLAGLRGLGFSELFVETLLAPMVGNGHSVGN